MADKLLDEAKTAQEKAYAPYSKFKVGAAILTPSGNIYSGSNVENAAYPQGQCAEASAIGAMVNGGEGEIAEITIYANGADECTPCGGCRQRIREFANDSVKINVANETGVLSTYTLGELLPHSFGPHNLNK